MINSYKEFSIAIDAKDIRKAEEIFSFSDNRLKLVKNYLQDSSIITIENVCSEFRSKGLREQALLLCSTCEKDTCSIKNNLKHSTTKVHLTNESNRLSNFLKHKYSNNHVMAS